MALTLRLPVALAAVALAACAGEGSDAVTVELSRSAARAEEGVAKIERSLGELELGSRGFGEGVRQVEQATRELAALETDERATEAQRLQALVLQARAWDDTAHVIGAAAGPDGGAARPAITEALREKAFPARIAARNGFERALRAACLVTGADPAVVLELVDGIARHGGPQITLDQACQ